MIDLYLVDPGKLVFNRVFYRYYFLLRLVQFGQCGIQRRGFTTTGGPGNQHQAMRPVNDVSESLQNIIRHAELIKLRTAEP